MPMESTADIEEIGARDDDTVVKASGGLRVSSERRGVLRKWGDGEASDGISMAPRRSWLLSR